MWVFIRRRSRALSTPGSPCFAAASRPRRCGRWRTRPSATVRATFERPACRTCSSSISRGSAPRAWPGTSRLPGSGWKPRPTGEAPSRARAPSSARLVRSRHGGRGWLGSRHLGGRTLAALEPELAEQGLIGRGLDDAVELAPVAAYEAHARDRDVKHDPPRAGLAQPVVEGNLRSAADDDLGADRGELPVHRLAHVDDPLAGMLLQTAEEGAPHEALEQADELVPLLPRPFPPALGERAPGHLGEVEELVGDALDLAAVPRRGVGLLEVGFLHDLHNLLHGGLDDLGRGVWGYGVCRKHEPHCQSFFHGRLPPGTGTPA